MTSDKRLPQKLETRSKYSGSTKMVLNWQYIKRKQCSVQGTEEGMQLSSGLMGDRLIFKYHVAKEATRAFGTLSRLMPNVGGPNSIKRILLSRVNASIKSCTTTTQAFVSIEHLLQNAERARVRSAEDNQGA